MNLFRLDGVEQSEMMELFTVSGLYSIVSNTKDIPREHKECEAFFEIEPWIREHASFDTKLSLKDITPGQVMLRMDVTKQDADDPPISALYFSAIEFPPIDKDSGEMAFTATWSAREFTNAANTTMTLVSDFSVVLTLINELPMRARLSGPALFAVPLLTNMRPEPLRSIHLKLMKQNLEHEKKTIEQEKTPGEMFLPTCVDNLTMNEEKLGQAIVEMEKAKLTVHLSRKTIRETEARIVGERAEKRRKLETIETKLRELKERK
jgi:hypothetical protein